MDYEIPKEYFLDEVRDGFFVPGMIKKTWAMSIIDYKILEEICEKKGYNIFFMYGSLIAVIRHGGSIPWDDDIDSMMFHREFNDLKKYLDNGGAPENYWMNDYTIMDNGNLVRKWTDNHEAVKNPERWKESFGFPFINNVDVMMLDYLPDGEDAMQYYMDVTSVIEFLKVLADLIETGYEDYDRAELSYNLNLLERVMKVKYDEKKDGKLSIWVWRMMDDFTASYSSKDGKYVASVAHHLKSGRAKFPKEYFGDYIDMPYEFTTVKVPIGYDGILRDFFGEYMEPRLEWDGHVYPFYRDMERALQEKYDVELLRYHFLERDVVETISGKEGAVRIGDVLRSSLDLFSEAHGYLCNSLESGIAHDGVLQEILGVLGSCQELAVNVGETVESRAIDKDVSDRIVHEMETYCEFIYGLYRTISGEDADSDELDVTKIREKLDEFEGFAREAASEEIRERRKVLFLCWKSEHWSSLHSIWEAAVADEEADVKVIAVPYFLKDGEGNIDRDDMICDTDYPDVVTLTPYDQYDLQAEHPDIVIYQAPYDEYSDAMTVHPYYYVSNLRKYAEELVFIPPFKIREITSGDERSKYAIGCFIKNPGIVYADKVIVQSDGMRETYISILQDMIKRDMRYVNEEWMPDNRDYSSTDYATEEQELLDKYADYVPESSEAVRAIDWEGKVLPLGSAIDDWKERSRVLICEEDATGRDEDDGGSENAGRVLYDKRGVLTEKTIYDEVFAVPKDWIERLKREDGSFRKVLLYVISAGVAFEKGAKVFEKAENAIRLIDSMQSDSLTVLLHVDRNFRKVLRKNNPAAWTACQKFLDSFKESRHIYDDSHDEVRAAKICDACYGDGSSVMNLCREYGRPVMIESPDIEVGVPEGDAGDAVHTGATAATDGDVSTGATAVTDGVASTDVTDISDEVPVDESKSVGAKIWKGIKN